jgi:hypothetical protein
MPQKKFTGNRPTRKPFFSPTTKKPKGKIKPFLAHLRDIGPTLVRLYQKILKTLVTEIIEYIPQKVKPA